MALEKYDKTLSRIITFLEIATIQYFLLLILTVFDPIYLHFLVQWPIKQVFIRFGNKKNGISFIRINFVI